MKNKKNQKIIALCLVTISIISMSSLSASANSIEN